MAPELNQQLLRLQLGFNGLVVSDATSMAGMTATMPRAQAVPLCVAAGCDMFLFDLGLEQDFAYMMKGIETGILTEERVEEAVTRILAGMYLDARGYI